MRRVLILTALTTAVVMPAVAQGQLLSSPPPQPVPAPPPPAPVPPPAPPPTPEPPPVCADQRLRCPDLVLRAPSELRTIRTPGGRGLLGSRNGLVNVGKGPLALYGRRYTARTMTVRQRIYRDGRGHRMLGLRGARLDFWRIPGQGRYWKLRDALRFELWTAGRERDRLVRRGRKTRFCMRDLLRSPRPRGGPRSRVFPSCSQSSRARRVRMGVSVGWVESYPAGYHEQYVDVTGLRGCFSLRHIADPRGHVHESDETNNESRTIVRLPLGSRPVGRC